MMDNSTGPNPKPQVPYEKMQIKNLEEQNQNKANSPQTNGTPYPDFKPGEPNALPHKGGFGLFIKKKKVKGPVIINTLGGAVVDHSLGTIREKSQESSTPTTHSYLATKAKLTNSVHRSSIYVRGQENGSPVKLNIKNSGKTLTSTMPAMTPGHDRSTKSNVTNLTKSTVNPIAKIQRSGYFIGDGDIAGELWSNANDRPLKCDEVRMPSSPPKKCTIQLSQVFDGRKICDPGECPVLLEQSDEDFWAFIEGTGPEPEKKVKPKPARENSPTGIPKRSPSRNCDENKSIVSRKSRK